MRLVNYPSHFLVDSCLNSLIIIIANERSLAFLLASTPAGGGKVSGRRVSPMVVMHPFSNFQIPTFSN
jgi:hypothetical protein